MSLYNAASRNNIEKVRELLGSGIYQGSVDERGRDPLGVASQFGYLEIVEELLEAGANPNTMSEGYTPLTSINYIRDEEIYFRMVKLLLDAGANPNIFNMDTLSPVNIAIDSYAPTAVKLLLDSGANPHYITNPAVYPDERYKGESYVDQAMRLLYKGFTTNSPNRERKVKEIITILLSRGVKMKKENLSTLRRIGFNKLIPDVDKTWKSKKLFKAVENNDIETVKELLRSGVYKGGVDEEGYDPIGSASQDGYLEIVKELLKAGGDPNTVSQGYTPLTSTNNIPDEKTYFKIAKSLLDAGADPNIFDKDTNSPVNIAINAIAPSVVELLLELGADPNYITIADLVTFPGNEYRGDSYIDQAVRLLNNSNLIENEKLEEIINILLNKGVKMKERYLNKLREIGFIYTQTVLPSPTLFNLVSDFVSKALISGTVNKKIFEETVTKLAKEGVSVSTKNNPIKIVNTVKRNYMLLGQPIPDDVENKIKIWESMT